MPPMKLDTTSARDPNFTDLGWLALKLPLGADTVRLIVEPSDRENVSVRIFGFLVDGVHGAGSLDVLAIDGSKVTDHLERGNTSISAFLARRNPQLVMTWYGTNSVVREDFDPIAYGDAYRTHLEQRQPRAPMPRALRWAHQILADETEPAS